jgi:phosphoserine phosphatase RsbU/P
MASMHASPASSARPPRRQLPLLGPDAPIRSEVDFHAVSRPARTFTGDFYFTRRLDDRLWFAVGDVAGKGLPAAVVMAMVQEELEQTLASCALIRCDAAAAVQRLDAFLRPILPSNRFVTAVVGQLRTDGTLILANAGHCPPLIARRDGTVERIASTGPVIGLLRTASWQSHLTRLDEDETLLVYSDGLLEATSPEGAEFGIERIEHVLNRPGAQRTARQISAQLVDEAAEHAKGVRADDLTVVVVKSKRV